MFTYDYIINLIKSTWDRANKEHVELFLNRKGGIDPLECLLMYLYIIKENPTLVLEIGPNEGYSTTAIALGMKQRGRKNAFWTIENSEKVFKKLKSNIEKYNLSEYVNLILGDGIEHGTTILSRESVYNSLFCEMLFIDADHREAFAKQYIDKIFPCLDNCLVGIHDIRALKRNNDGYGDFNTSLLNPRTDEIHGHGEELAIKDYLKDKEYTLLHAVSGGKHEAAHLDVNDELYDEILCLTGFEFRVKGICPKSIWFKETSDV